MLSVSTRCVVLLISIGWLCGTSLFAASNNYHIVQIDRSQLPDTLTVRFTVTDSTGMFVSGLTEKSDSVEQGLIRVFEEQGSAFDPVDILSLSEIHRQDDERYSFALALDHSSSMGPHIRDLFLSVKKFIDAKNTLDEVCLIKFDNSFKTVVSSKSNRDSLLQQFPFEGLRGYGGFTAMYAAAGHAIHEIKPSERQRVLVLFTDGDDNASRLFTLSNGYGLDRPSHLVEYARSLNVPVFIVGLGEVNHELMKRICIATDGQFYPVDNGNEIKGIFGDLPGRLSQYYEVKYRPQYTDDMYRLRISGRDGEVIDSTILTTDIDFTQWDTLYEKPTVVAHFETDNYEIEERYHAKIQLFVDCIQVSPYTLCQVIGHADLKGSASYNRVLSRRRAEAVRSYLVGKGVSSSKVVCEGHGEDAPLYPVEQNESQKKANRRVEIQLIDTGNRTFTPEPPSDS